MKRIIGISLAVFVLACNPAQKAASDIKVGDPYINATEAARIENVLASNEMRGRKTFSPEIDKAADFISAEFRAAGLEPWPGNKDFKQSFAMIKAKQVSVSGSFDGTEVSANNTMVITCQPNFRVTQADNYEKVFIKAEDNLGPVARQYYRQNKNLLVICDKKHSANFGGLSRVKASMFKSNHNVVFILADQAPANYDITAVHEITEQPLANVVGVLPGKSKKNEFVIFSAHYDHIGVGKPVENDSIYNGANDDAAGTTAVIMLAKHFQKLNNNERTLVFATFTAEEIGGYGSQYFSRQFDPATVIAMFNIEMIGTESNWGKNSVYITGYDRSNMGEIMKENLKGSDFTVYPDPYPQQDLFYRSDNATLARLGVPAHSISTAKMDKEPHYHKVSDEVRTLDLENLATVTKGIAVSASSIISGKDTPTRVNTANLR